MSTKACKLKLCGCMGVAVDNQPTLANFIRGVEAGFLDILPDILGTQEDEFVKLVDDVAQKSAIGTLDTKTAVNSLMEFGMKIAN